VRRWLLCISACALSAGACTAPSDANSQEAAPPARRESIGGGSAALAGRDGQSGRQIVVEQATLEEPGYLVVYANGAGAPAAQMGVSKLLPEGRHEDVSVELSDEADRSVFVIAHVERGGNERFDPAVDAPVAGDAGVVSVQLSVGE
jgi:hypothetical protein